MNDKTYNRIAGGFGFSVFLAVFAASAFCLGGRPRDSIAWGILALLFVPGLALLIVNGSRGQAELFKAHQEVARLHRERTDIHWSLHLEEINEKVQSPITLWFCLGLGLLSLAALDWFGTWVRFGADTLDNSHQVLVLVLCTAGVTLLIVNGFWTLWELSKAREELARLSPIHADERRASRLVEEQQRMLWEIGALGTMPKSRPKTATGFSTELPQTEQATQPPLQEPPPTPIPEPPIRRALFPLSPAARIAKARERTRAAEAELARHRARQRPPS